MFHVSILYLFLLPGRQVALISATASTFPFGSLGSQSLSVSSDKFHTGILEDGEASRGHPFCLWALEIGELLAFCPG